MTPEQRHNCMGHIRGKDTKPEIIVRRFLFSHGYRYRVHVKRLPGTPDIVLRRLHTVIQVNGCFWHGHKDGCTIFKMPKSNLAYWIPKIERNRDRDLKTCSELTALGWNVIKIWECQLLPDKREDTLQSLIYTLSKIELSLVKPPSIWKNQIIQYDFESTQTISMVADDSEI